MSAKSTECYTTDSHARCLRVEISATQSLLLPLDQFAFSELVGDGKEQKLRLVFATHEVLVLGHTLRRIETAMQRMELSSVMQLPEKFQSLIGENQPKIRGIVITEIQPGNANTSALN